MVVNLKVENCSKLLKNIHVLEELIKSSKLERDEHISSIVNSFKYLKSVKAACLASGLLPEYELTINKYKEAYIKLGLRVSPKVHALMLIKDWVFGLNKPLNLFIIILNSFGRVDKKFLVVLKIIHKACLKPWLCTTPDIPSLKQFLKLKKYIIICICIFWKLLSIVNINM